jgi:hypothetical protein
MPKTIRVKRHNLGFSPVFVRMADIIVNEVIISCDADG